MNSQNKPTTYNAANEKHVNKARKKEKQLHDQEMDDLRSVMATEYGRRVMWRLMAHCRAFKSIYEQSARIHYNSGKQDVGFYILELTKQASPELWLKMQNENMLIEKGEN